jgi:hypothetical protein
MHIVMPDLFSINRNALTMRPKQPMVDWLNSLYPEDPMTLETAISHDGLDIILIPEFDSTEDALAWLKENFADFFTFALDEWCEDESRWPAPLTWELFEQYIDYSIQSVVVDSVDDDDSDDSFFFTDDDFDDFDDDDDDDDEETEDGDADDAAGKN